MHHRVKAHEIRLGEVTHIFAELGDLGCRFTEVTAGEQIRIQSDNIVASGLQDRSGNSTDVTLMPG